MLLLAERQSLRDKIYGLIGEMNSMRKRLSDILEEGINQMVRGYSSALFILSN
jgi:hypothetical protein